MFSKFCLLKNIFLTIFANPPPPNKYQMVRPQESVSPKMLSYNVVNLLTILLGQYTNSGTHNSIAVKTLPSFSIPEILKHTKPGNLSKLLVYHKYP